MAKAFFTRVPRDSTNGRQHRLLIASAIGQLQDNALVEEAGTWSPIICSSGPSAPWTMSSQIGWYRKHGAVVQFQFDVQWTAKHATVANPCITLPFAADGHTNTFASPCLIGVQNPALSTAAFLAPYNGTDLLFVYSAAPAPLAYAAFASAGRLSGSGFYLTKS